MSYRAWRSPDGVKVGNRARTMTLAQAIVLKATLERRIGYLKQHERDDLKALSAAILDGKSLEPHRPASPLGGGDAGAPSPPSPGAPAPDPEPRASSPGARQPGGAAAVAPPFFPRDGG